MVSSLDLKALECLNYSYFLVISKGSCTEKAFFEKVILLYCSGAFAFGLRSNVTEKRFLCAS